MFCPEELRPLEVFWHLNRAPPRRSDFTPEELRPWLGNLAIVVVERQVYDLRFPVALSDTQLDQLSRPRRHRALCR
mgnify:CR=1 FL=1